MRVRARRQHKSLRLFKNVIISALCLFSIGIGVAGGYIWYIGKYGPKDTSSAEKQVEVKTETTIKKNIPDPNAPVGVATQMLTSPIAPGSVASLSIRTNPGANCVVSVIYDKTPSKDAGLAPKTADDFGSVSWTWTVDSLVPIGKWPVSVNCSNNKNSGVLTLELVVSR